MILSLLNDRRLGGKLDDRHLVTPRRRETRLELPATAPFHHLRLSCRSAAHHKSPRRARARLCSRLLRLGWILLVFFSFGTSMIERLLNFQWWIRGCEGRLHVFLIVYCFWRRFLRITNCVIRAKLIRRNRLSISAFFLAIKDSF